MYRLPAVSPAPSFSGLARAGLRWALPGALAVLLAVAGPAHAAQPVTPAQMLGPFYPLQPDPAAGNELANAAGAGRALGLPLAIVGRVLDTRGRPRDGVLVEIWQTNAHGRYHHPHDDSPRPLDPNFSGYGRATTGADGAYRFATIMPVAYPGRAPHVHFRLSRAGRELLVTQMYLPGEAGAANAADGVFASVPDPDARRLLVGVPAPGATATLRFDIVLE